MPADGEPVPVDLEPVAKSRLHDPLAALDLADQPDDVGAQIGIDAGDVLRHDRPEQQPAEAGRRVDREDEVAEGDPARRHRGPRVEHLQLGEQHRPGG